MAEQSLFGIFPEALQASRAAALREQALQYAKLDPFQRATAGIYQGANQLGGAIGGLLGAQDPEMMRASTLKQLASQFDTTTAKGLTGFARAAAQAGLPQQAMQAAQQAQEMNKQAQAMQLQKAQIDKVTAEQKKLDLANQQEATFREELLKLGPTPTQEGLLAAAAKSGSADKVLAAIQSSVDKEAARAQALTLFREKLENDAKIAKEKGETAAQQKQRDFENKQTLLQFAASLKGPSPAVLKAQEKADKIAEGREGLTDTVEVAKKLVNDLAKEGGMTSTSASSFSNLVTSLGTGTVGQAGGRLFGTTAQTKRDELKSVRLQLLSAVKEATGLSSTQLNSNVELQTWLNSLGGESMTKEANLAILNNISNRYLKKGAAKTDFTSVQEATGANLPKGTIITINGRRAVVE